MTAKTDSGIRIKILVFRPIRKFQVMPINLSQSYSTIIVKIPLVLGSCSNVTISLGKRSDALSHFTASVLGDTKSLFLITISYVCVRVSSLSPLPSTKNTYFYNMIENLTLDFGS